ncbi:DUF4352 domain-containing protein [Bacillaceae bacterium W0354]
MKKLWQSLIVVALVFFLAACGGDDEEKNNNNDAANEQQDQGNANQEQNNDNNDANNSDNNQQDNNNDDTNATNDSKQDNASKTGSIGDTLEFNGLQITVNDAYTSQGGDFETPSNDQYLILDLNIENPTDEAQNVSSLLQMSVQDEEGYTYDVTIFTETKGSLDGEVGPGRNMRGEVAFDVDESPSYEFIFEDPFASGQAIWTINLNE